MNTIKPPITYAFFGSSVMSIHVLDQLERQGLHPTFIVTTPDKPQGRSLKITPNVVKTWAIDKNIPVFSPEKLDDEFVKVLRQTPVDVFIVASYGKIIPPEIISIPLHKCLNIHPSLLPKYRGASPLQSATIDDCKKTGVTIIQIDEKMDHGPIVAQKEIIVYEWPTYEEFEKMMATVGATLLAEIMPQWIDGSITAVVQGDTLATYTKKFTKQDGLIELSGDAYLNFRKIQAFHEWPQAYFLIEQKNKSENIPGSKTDSKQIRVKITQANFKDNILTIEKVIPEGGKEMSYEDFKRGYTGL